jgi:hypothetical protein
VRSFPLDDTSLAPSHYVASTAPRRRWQIV